MKELSKHLWCPAPEACFPNLIADGGEASLNHAMDALCETIDALACKCYRSTDGAIVHGLNGILFLCLE